MGYLSIKQISEKWGISVIRIQVLYSEERITLTGLVNKEAVVRTGNNPPYYHLANADVVIPRKPVQNKKGYRDDSSQSKPIW